MHGIRALCYRIQVHLEDFRNSIKLDSVLCSEIQGLQPINSWRLQSFSQRRSRRQFSSLEAFCQNRQKKRRRNVSSTKTATMRWTKALRMPIHNARQMELAIPDNFTEIVSPPIPLQFLSANLLSSKNPPLPHVSSISTSNQLLDETKAAPSSKAPVTYACSSTTALDYIKSALRFPIDGPIRNKYKDPRVASCENPINGLLKNTSPAQFTWYENSWERHHRLEIMSCGQKSGSTTVSWKDRIRRTSIDY